MPWEILGLDEKTATERDIKRAYARLLKTHRPDKDPEGFQRINEAFQRAKMGLAWREEYGGDDDASDDAVALESGAFSEADIQLPIEDPLAALSISSKTLPKDFASRLEKLERSLADEGGFEVQVTMEHFAALCISNPGCVDEWGESVVRVFSDRESLLGEMVDNDMLLRELDQDLMIVTSVAVGVWSKELNTEKMEALAQRLLAEPQRFTGESATEIAIRLAHCLAVSTATVSAKLVDLAYRQLPPGNREWRLGRIDHLIAIASEFTWFPAGLKQFWGNRLAEPYGVWDWDDANSREAIRYLTTDVPSTWSGYALLENVMPEDLWKRVIGSRRIQRSHRKMERIAVRDEEVTGVSPKSSWWLFALVFIVIKVVVALSSNSNRSSPASMPSAPIIVPGYTVENMSQEKFSSDAEGSQLIAGFLCAREVKNKGVEACHEILSGMDVRLPIDSFAYEFFLDSLLVDQDLPDDERAKIPDYIARNLPPERAAKILKLHYEAAPEIVKRAITKASEILTSPVDPSEENTSEILRSLLEQRKKDPPKY